MTRALIIGGGVAGPVVAMALQRAGVDATVYEAQPRRDDDVGSYFTVTTNGIDALRAIDAASVAASIGYPTNRNVMWNDRGRHLGTIPLGTARVDGVVSRTMKRAHLSHALQTAAEDRGIEIQFGKRFLDVIERPDGRIAARFEDGTEATGDLLVGADGIHSRIRRIIDPTAPAGRYVGLTNFGGYTPRAGIDVDPGPWNLIFGRRAFFGYSVDPSGGAVWFVNLPRPEIDVAERATTSLDDWKRQLADAFRSDAGPAVDLIERGKLELAGDNTYDLPHVPVWHRGRMIVIGDAAHAPSPSSGQGASMAIEDGVVLAKAVRDAASIEAAFASYERARRERVERIVAQGARSSSSKTPGRAGRAVRDAMMPILFRYVITERSLRWMYDYRIDWTVRLDGATSARSQPVGRSPSPAETAGPEPPV
jgi:2-polyprenyl-6-methoxyphenol hydroxylase-like FAD-dependent oxidoreductase